MSAVLGGRSIKKMHVWLLHQSRQAIMGLGLDGSGDGMMQADSRVFWT